MKFILKKEQCKTKKFLSKGYKDIHLKISYIVELSESELILINKYDFWNEKIVCKETNKEGVTIKDISEGIKLTFDSLHEIIQAEKNAKAEADALKVYIDSMHMFGKKELIEF